ncbi:hypothetical protein HPB50_016736 [Hyalomma asiaticum]|uniref:Uncharacterized protein n=1 Tax=Hyalomma asiaticum TaxID=266040 RepID=A0ACB7SLQ7_HYAAI|nr:hypothetical protein HPB50_016736 [Hyalomma asiaticum]
MEYQVDGESITPAELEADSRWIRAVKAHRAAAAHQPITWTPPSSTPSYTTPSAPTLRRHAPLPRLPAEDFKIVFRPGGGLDLRTTTNGVLLQTLCSLATIDYAAARTADRVRMNPYNNSLIVSTPSESRARLYLRVSELRLGTISYSLRAYMAAPDNALRGIIYNAVDSQTQDEIIQDPQSMNVNTAYAIADARRMGRSKSILITFVGTATLPSSIVFNCGVTAATRFVRKPRPARTAGLLAIAQTFAPSPSPPSATAAARPTRQLSPRPASHAVSSPASLTSTTHQAHPQELPAFPPPPPIYVSFPPLPRSEASAAPATTNNTTTATPPVSSITQPHTSDPKIAALEATITAQQLQIQELTRQLQAALARLSSPAPPPSPAPTPTQTPSPPAPAEESMNTAPSAASSRVSSPTRRPPHIRRSPSSDAIAPHERNVVRETACFLESFQQRIMTRFTRLEERVALRAIGSSVQRDTNPDLALARNVADSSWSNTGISLGSDHYVLCTTFPLPSLARSSTRLAQVVDWDRFRSIRLSTSSSSPITDLSAWTETILADVRSATSTLRAAPHSTTADSRLLHLWEAYHAVHRRWQAQKHNRRLRLRLARLASDMEEHCSSLLRQQWGQTCDRMAGNLGLRDTWSLLRVLLDPTHTKASQRKDISHLLHSSSLTDTEFLHDLRRLVQAFVLSRFVYSLPYLFLSRTEDDKAYKSALSLPTSTSTDRLLSMGVHNSLKELTDAHRTAQPLRLSRTRPEQRASALWRKFGRQPAVAYVDAAPYRHYAAHALAVTENSLQPTITASVCTSTSVEAEEAAIALAITQTSAEYIFSDSKPAVYNYAVGRVAPPAAGNLRPPPPGMDTRDALLTYHDITMHYRLSRLTFPPPHQSLSQHQQHLWRQLQAHTFLTPTRLALFHPGTYSPACRLCGSSIANYQHIFYSCPAHSPPASWHIRSPQQWEAALSSTRPDLQLRLVTWAEDVAARHCLDATTGSLKAAHNAAF